MGSWLQKRTACVRPCSEFMTVNNQTKNFLIYSSWIRSHHMTPARRETIFSKFRFKIKYSFHLTIFMSYSNSQSWMQVGEGGWMHKQQALFLAHACVVIIHRIGFVICKRSLIESYDSKILEKLDSKVSRMSNVNIDSVATIVKWWTMIPYLFSVDELIPAQNQINCCK